MKRERERERERDDSGKGALVEESLVQDSVGVSPYPNSATA